MITLRLSQKKMKNVDSKKIQSNVKFFLKKKSSLNEEFINELH
jgi:hypothetical protein